MSVYFAQVGRYIKVGYSRNPERRVADLFSSATRYARPADCPTTGARLIAAIDGDLGTERTCHAALGDFAAGGEFFVDEPAVRSFITEARAGRFPTLARGGGPFEPTSLVTAEDEAHLLSVVTRMFDRTVA